MAEPATLLYLEPDDEITSVVRRLREADATRVVLVASGRSKATTSAVALRLLAGVAAEEGREIALVADAAGRGLAGEAGIAAFASVAEATADDPVPSEPAPARLAPIRVVRGEEARVAAAPPPPRPGPSDETRAAPVVAPPPGPSRPAMARPPWNRGRPWPRAVGGALVVGLLLSVGLLAAVAPAASIVITPTRLPIQPVQYTLVLTATDAEEGEVSAEAEGEVTGVFRDPSPAVGEVTFSNYNTSPVRVDAGTQVAAGDVVFATAETVVVPTGFFTIPGTERVAITAVEPGPAGNLPADAIDTILNEAVRNALRAFSDNPNRIVRNEEATAGGAENRQPEVIQEDVDAAVQRVREDLSAQLDEALGHDPTLVYGPARAGEPQLEVPEDLVGRRGEETFMISGTLTYRRPHVTLAEVRDAAIERVRDDPGAAPEGRQVVPDSVEVEVGEVAGEGDELSVTVTVTADSDPLLDDAAIRERVAGRTEEEAETDLAWLGEVDVELWPGWVDRVPELEWRIELRVKGEPEPSGSGSP
ncbi:MAG TPA: baseplate J/gp47 family protein [Candidatus Limnocylindria bacterium]